MEARTSIRNSETLQNKIGSITTLLSASDAASTLNRPIQLNIFFPIPIRRQHISATRNTHLIVIIIPLIIFYTSFFS